MYAYEWEGRRSAGACNNRNTSQFDVPPSRNEGVSRHERDAFGMMECLYTARREVLI